MAFAFAIGFISLWYTNNLVEELEREERQKAKLWADATRLIASPDLDENVDLNFLLDVVKSNNTIPVILTDKKGEVTAHLNLDTALVNQPGFLEKKIVEMKESNEPMEIEYIEGDKIFIYYENSTILSKLRYYPFIQLSVIGLFLIFSYVAFSYSRRSEQNRVWVGMSKETAHQLGTPISSLVAWLELLKASEGKVDPYVIEEIAHDVERLELITERFSKIGSEPVLEPQHLFKAMDRCVKYLQVRAPSKVNFNLEKPEDPEDAELYVALNYPLFAWVIENLTKNAIDAMSGQGSLTYTISSKGKNAVIDITDTGKGIPSGKFETIFNPGYTTKKRGWGLGLSLVKRIIENYHKGHISVKESTPFQRTTFRIVLKAQ